MTDLYDEEQFRELLSEYDSLQEIADEEGLNRFSLGKWCRRHGVWPESVTDAETADDNSDEGDGSDEEENGSERQLCPDCGEPFKSVDLHISKSDCSYPEDE